MDIIDGRRAKKSSSWWLVGAAPAPATPVVVRPEASAVVVSIALEAAALEKERMAALILQTFFNDPGGKVLRRLGNTTGTGEGGGA